MVRSFSWTTSKIQNVFTIERVAMHFCDSDHKVYQPGNTCRSIALEPNAFLAIFKYLKMLFVKEGRKLTLGWVMTLWWTRARGTWHCCDCEQLRLLPWTNGWDKEH